MDKSEDIFISTDKSLLNINVIFNFLSGSYWANGRSINTIKKSIKNSLCFGVYQNNKQIGFARVITDYSTFIYIADVFILEEYRGKGYSKRLINTIKEFPVLQNVRRWMLATKDAHGLYEQYGFVPLKNPERFMEIVNPSI